MGELVLYNKGRGKGVLGAQAQPVVRRTVDYGSNVVRWLEDSLARHLVAPKLQCHYSFTKELTLPFATPMSPYNGICCRFVYSASTRTRAPVNVVHWFPNGRRLISGTQSGEMTIWNGQNFQFENIMQAHNAAVKAMEWTPEETVLVSGDQLGVIKFWDQNLYNFQTFQAHKESMCDISISPTGLKFCSCADDSHAKLWDLRTGEEERAFTGHGWDVKCCSWHPTKGLVATGSKDAQIKLWDPRVGEAITTIFSHKNTVTRVKWSPSGQFLASGSKDQLVMLMDIRTMSVRQVFKAHQKEVTSLCWHPESDSLLASGGYDYQLNFWDTHGSKSSPLKSLPGAHEGPIWSLAWHPLGHLLVSGSHDYSTRFWSRARPGDESFEQFLPKKVAAPSELPASAIPPPPPVPMNVLDSGIFAGKPPKDASSTCPIMESAKAKSKMAAAAASQLALANEEAKPAGGLSQGEGANAKGILDTADFDELDDKPASTPAANKTEQAKPAEAAAKASPEAAAKAAPEASAKSAVEKPADAAAKAASEKAPAAPSSAAPAPAPAEAPAKESPEAAASTKRAAPDSEATKEDQVEAKKLRTEEDTPAKA